MSRLWENIFEGGKLVPGGGGIKVGEGSKVYFRWDDWLGVDPLCLLLPRLFREFVSWELSLSRVLCQFEEIELESLLSLLTNNFLCTKEATFYM